MISISPPLSRLGTGTVRVQTVEELSIYLFSQRTYIAPLRDDLPRGAPRSTSAIKNSLQMLVKESIAKRARRSEERLFHVVGPTTEKAQRFVLFTNCHHSSSSS